MKIIMSIKNIFEYIILGLLFVIEFVFDGYIGNISLLEIIGYMAIFILLYKGFMSFKTNKKIEGFVRVLISISLIIMCISKYI